MNEWEEAFSDNGVKKVVWAGKRQAFVGTLKFHWAGVALLPLDGLRQLITCH